MLKAKLQKASSHLYQLFKQDPLLYRPMFYAVTVSELSPRYLPPLFRPSPTLSL